MVGFTCMPGASQPERNQGGGKPAQFALMDRIYRRQRHIYDLTRRHYLAGRLRLIRGLNAAPGQRILEIGCGTAWNLIRIAERYPGTHLWGVDASAEMLRSATEAIRRSKLSDRITLIHGLAEDIPGLFAMDPAFDRVVFSYSLSMIEDWNQAIMAATRIAGAQAEIHVVDFGDLESLWPASAALLRTWLRLFHVHPRSEFVHRVEKITSGRTDCSLHLLPGRYAFVFRGSIAAISELSR
jgi:S-adenosylmethionine-diacylgycerolhomoserine-N-methlytransferase